jgi:hypothetical protein
MDKFEVPEERAQSGKCSLFIGQQIAVATFAVRLPWVPFTTRETSTITRWPGQVVSRSG